MLALAQWILKGRYQAAAVVLIALATSPWISINALIGSAALALVWLRKGEQEGVFLSLWALLPAFCIAYVLHSYTTVLLVLSVCLTSFVLRKTSSWRLTLMSLSALGLVTGFCLEFLANSSLQHYVTICEQFVQQLQQQMSSNQQLGQYLPKTITTDYIAGLLSTIIVLGNFISLVFARSWQAKLFNPGGFQQEFHAIRMSRIDVIIALVIAGIFIKISGAYVVAWFWIPIFPLFISGIALFHAIALSKHLAIQWYIIFYIVLIFLNPLKLFIVIVACVDTYLDIRKKISPSSTE